jgi:hypothetical protein
MTAESEADILRTFKEFAPRRTARPRLLPSFATSLGLLAIAFLALALLASSSFRASEAAFLEAHPRENPGFLRGLYRGTALLVLLGTAASSLALRSRRGRRGTYGDARFVAPEREFGDRKNAVAAMLVSSGAPSPRFVRPSKASSRQLAYLTWDQLSRHVLVVGQTGSGKTTGLFNHLLLSSRVPWIYQDQKAELPLWESFPDRPVWGLDTRGAETRSLVWNPVEEIRGADDAELVAALVLPDRGDEYDWVIRSARFILEGLLKTGSFGSLQALARAVENEPEEKLLRRLPSGARIAGPRQRGYFIQALLEVVRPWSSARVSRVSSGPSEVTLDDFIEQGGYVLSNDDRALRGPVTLFWGMLLHRLRNRGSNAPRVLLLLDEFGDAGRIPNMASALALYRSKNVGIVAGVQTYSLMKTVYGSEWEAIRDGFGTVFVMTANLPKDMYERLSRELGRFTRRQPSVHLGPAGLSLTLGQVGMDLVSTDRWGHWGEARACLARGHYPTWWVPRSITLGAASARPGPTATAVGDK